MSGGITFYSRGDFSKTTRFLNWLKGKSYRNVLEKYGELGVELLRDYTPKDSGETANSWNYIIEETKDEISLTFINTHVEKGQNIAILLQYGHGTGTGGYVAGRDYINPAIQPLFDKLADAVWKEVTNS